MANIGLFHTIDACRQFFRDRGFLETPTPPLVTHPGMEVHLHPFQIKSVQRNKELPLYLHTSPEFEMKSLLSEGLEKIYHLGYCFRDEPDSETHRAQFLMLEWYRAHSHYHEVLEDTLALIKSVQSDLINKGHPIHKSLEIQKFTADELFERNIGFKATDFLETEQLAQKIHQDFPNLLPTLDPSDLWPWEDYFFLLFLNFIEPTFKKSTIVVVDEFPAPLAALSTLHPNNAKVCQRFEIYLSGVELCNCFNELTDIDIQKKRFEIEAKKKQQLYHYNLGEPEILYKALKKGLSPSSGNALGVERLYLGLLNQESPQCFYR